MGQRGLSNSYGVKVYRYSSRTCGRGGSVLLLRKSTLQIYLLLDAVFESRGEANAILLREAVEENDHVGIMKLAL